MEAVDGNEGRMDSSRLQPHEDALRFIQVFFMSLAEYHKKESDAPTTLLLFVSRILLTAILPQCYPNP